MKLDHLVLFASVAAILGAMGYSISSPFPVTRFTEFYLHPDSAGLAYGITNYERKHITYGVEGHFIKGDERLPLFDETVRLADKGAFTSQIADELPRGGIVVLELYRKDLPQSRPYRTLHFNTSKGEGE